VQRTYARENLQLEIMFPITWGGVWDYPYPEAQTLIRDLRDRFGAHKLIWGSDMPNVERFCTYRQCVDYVRRYCEFLTAAEKDLILGQNVAELCGIGS
jgi:predicted TIM-barrel fold metal-dependent hydrolase